MEGSARGKAAAVANKKKRAGEAAQSHSSKRTAKETATTDKKKKKAPTSEAEKLGGSNNDGGDTMYIFTPARCSMLCFVTRVLSTWYAWSDKLLICAQYNSTEPRPRFRQHPESVRFSIENHSEMHVEAQKKLNTEARAAEVAAEAESDARDARSRARRHAGH